MLEEGVLQATTWPLLTFANQVLGRTNVCNQEIWRTHPFGQFPTFEISLESSHALQTMVGKDSF
jgi:hypothetical protein